MKKKRLLLLGVITAVPGLSIALLFARQLNNDRGSPAAIPAPIVQENKLVQYRVGRVIRSSNAPHEATVIISVEPENFARIKMVKLAHQLKQDFSDAELLRVEILDDQNITDNYVPAGDMYRLFNKAKRGAYVLNRKTQDEYVQFSTAHGKPIDEIKIDLRSHGKAPDP